VKFAAKTPEVGRRFYWASAAVEPPEKTTCGEDE